MLVTLSHCSVFTVGRAAEAALVFPGAAVRPDLKLGTAEPETLGYVRSGLLVPASWKSRSGEWDEEDRVDGAPAPPKPPFGDYPSALRTPAHAVVAGHPNVLVISTRNVLNEVGYQARIGGGTYRTGRDRPLPGGWPVLCVRRAGPRTMNFCPHADAAADVDFVSGLPPVIDGRASGRAFLVARSSDVTHSYTLDAQGRIGPPNAWGPVSDEWNRLHSRRLAGESVSDDEFTDRVDEVARRFGLPVGPDGAGPALPHSIVAERDGGAIEFLTLSAPLWNAARFLAAHGYRHAVVLDQSGSVGHYFADEHGKIRTLVSSSNYRDAGTCFLRIETGGHVGVARHRLVP